ncbi:MAG: helix-turn-helix domain-containing protein [Puniceicoccaceae bacterium]
MKTDNPRIGELEERIGRFVRDRRRAGGLTQVGLAERCGIVRRTVFSLENGEGGNLRTLLAVLAELDALEEVAVVFSENPGGGGAAQPRKRRRALPAKDRQAGGVAENPWVLDRRPIL